MPTEQEFQDAKEQAEKEHKAPANPNAIGRAVGIDIGPRIKGDVTNPDETCLRFYVERKIRDKKAIDERFDVEKYGVPSDVIEIGRIVRFQGGPGSLVGFDQRKLPSNVDPANFGTMSAVVGIGSKHYILASNHAMAVNGRATDARIAFKPPSLIDDPQKYIFARITDHVHLTQAGPNTVDCALAEIEDQFLGRVRAEFPNRIVTSGDGIEPGVNMPVTKVDESEETKGKIVSINAQPRFDFSFGSFDFQNLVLIEGDEDDGNRPFAKPGDSGSLVAGFDKDEKDKDKNYKATAIIIGGSRRRLINGRWKSYTFACSFNAAIAKLEEGLGGQVAGTRTMQRANDSPEYIPPAKPKIQLVFTLPPPPAKVAASTTAGKWGSRRPPRLSTAFLRVLILPEAHTGTSAVLRRRFVRRANKKSARRRARRQDCRRYVCGVNN
jgi:hypothetical protein